MKKYLILCVSLALISLTSCNESYEELDDVQQTAEQMSRKQLDDALSELSEIYGRNVVVVETPTADNSETIAMVEKAMKSIGDDKKDERYVVVSATDVFVGDIFDHPSVMSQRSEENIPSGSYTFLQAIHPNLPCDITMNWSTEGIGLSFSDPAFSVGMNNLIIDPFTYENITGYFTVHKNHHYYNAYSVSGYFIGHPAFSISNYASLGPVGKD